MSKEAVLDKVRKLEKLPTLPEVLNKILSLKNENYSIVNLENIISKDPVITAKVIKVANTLYFNPYGYRVTSLKRAIELIGLNNLFSVILSMVIPDLFPIEKNSLYRELFWKHSFVCAFICRRLAKFCCDVDTDSAFTVGLLHDIGKLVLLIYFKDDYEKALTYIGKGLPSYLAELRVLGVSHDEVGAVLLETWGLPEVISNAVRFHHNLVDGKNFDDITGLVHVANILTMLSGFSYNSGILMVVLDDDPAWRRFKGRIVDPDYEIHKVFDDIVHAIDLAEIAWSREW